jgi:putative ABC transport system substrate-binding protein
VSPPERQHSKGVPVSAFITRAINLWCTLIFLMCALFAGCSEKPAKKYHVGILSGLDFFFPTADGFRQRMAELGYVEGKNITYDIEKTGFDMSLYRSAVQSFVAARVDLILVFPTEASIEAKSVTGGSSIPVVFANAFTENTDLVKSIREPGGNTTGVRWDGPDLALQRFETMREIVPTSKRILVPYQRGYPIVKSQLDALRTAAAAAAIELVEVPADNTADLDTTIRNLAAAGKLPDAILLIAEPLLVTPEAATALGSFASRYRIPVGGNMMPSTGQESIFGIRPENIPQGRQAAFIADKILRGAAPGTIPVVTAENFLTINYAAALKLGLKISEGLLGRADKIIR